MVLVVCSDQLKLQDKVIVPNKAFVQGASASTFAAMLSAIVA